MKRVARRMLVSTLCLSAGSAKAAVPESKVSSRYPLTAEAIARSLHNDGLDVHAEDVRMPMLLSTSVSDPALEVVGADRLPDGHLRLRLRCRKAGECLTFSVTLSHGAASPLLFAAGSAAPIAVSSLPAPVSSAQPAMVHTSLADSPAAPVSLHAGDKLTLLLDDGHLHIHLPVIALGSATDGKEVRVATPDGKQKYRAVVLSPTTVKGIME